MRLSSKLRLPALLFVFGLIFGTVTAGAALAYQSHMVNARNDLQSALAQLQAAEPDKGGHRVNAINLVKQAIGETNLGIQAAAH